MRKVFLDELPKKIVKGKESIDWLNHVGNKVNFIYDEYSGEIIITGIKSKRKIYIEHNNKVFEIDIYIFADARLEKIIGKISKDFRVNIGAKFNDDRRSLIITGREFRTIGADSVIHKFYKYTCNNCGWTGMDDRA